MKKMAKRVTAILLIILMFSISPLSGAAPTAHAEEDTTSGEDKSNDEDKSDDDDSDGNIYISEVRIGMGETEAEAKSELESEGFTILTDDGGAPADLNTGAGSKSALKRGANDKIVYLGYKTTTDINDAVTDLAVMNMEGGYSLEDYNMLMEKQMKSQIKPFVDNFKDTLDEYRANYKKPAKSINHIRADYMRKMLNLLTDDDTGGQPLGDLLLNKTKYELGDEEYNKLSDEEKKNHCDILTLLMQANGRATLTMETLLTKAADSSDDTWIDRLSETGLDDLMDQVEKENPSLTSRTDLMAELDRRYGDTAEKLLDKWEDLRSKLDNMEDTAEEFAESFDETGELVESVEDIDLLEASEEQLDDCFDATQRVDEQIQDVQALSVYAYLESVEYEDGTLLDFFSEDLSGDDDDIRRLYPVVDSLTAGQIAGLEFVSLEDLISIAMSDEEAYKKLEESASDLSVTSVYENVNREIYDKGGVALTDEALRAKAATNDTGAAEYKPGTLTTILWCATAGALAATVTSAIVRNVMVNSVVYSTVEKFYINNGAVFEHGAYAHIWNNAKEIQNLKLNVQNTLNGGPTGNFTMNAAEQASMQERLKSLVTREKEIENNMELAKEWGTGNVAKYLSVGFAVITVILTVVSTVMTMLEASKFYDTEYTPIPKYMVDRADITAINKKGEEVMVKNQTAYYSVVRCNRNAGNNDITKKNYETMGDACDLCGDIGTQWLALYSVKYEYGSPILADSLKYQKGDGSLPDGYSTGIHEFGSKPAANLNKAAYLFVDDAPAIKVYFKRAKIDGAQSLKAEGSIFSGGAGIALGGGVGLVVGALFGGLIVSRRKKIDI